MGFMGAIGGMAAGPIGAIQGSVGQDAAGIKDPQIGGIWTPWSTPGEGWQSTDAAPALPGYEAPQGVGYGAATSIQAPNINQAGLNQYRDLATGDTNPWTKNQLAEEQHNTQNDQDAANIRASTAGTTAWDQMAMNGGVRSGASERVAEQAGIGRQLAGQQINQASRGRQLGIQTAGQNQKLQALQNLPGMEIANAQPGIQASEFNVNTGLAAENQRNQNALQQSQNKNAFNAQNYESRAKMYGAKQLADQEEYDKNNKSLWSKIF